MAGNFIAALKQIKYGVDRVDKGDPYLFLNAPLEVSDAIFPRSLSGFRETPEIASEGIQKETVDAGRDSIFARRSTNSAILQARSRVHQQAFRMMVLDAYGDNCTVCHLKHAELLDAAHIIPDGKPRGEPVVPNGLSLCKIHHAAFDNNIIGINPDYIIKVREDVLEEHDGPMLRHGLSEGSRPHRDADGQELHGQKIILPRSTKDWPDRERLEVRWGEFG